MAAKQKEKKPKKKSKTNHRRGSRPTHSIVDKKFNLNKRQSEFCHFFIVNKGNATKAVIDAGYSERAANRAAARLLSNVDIKRKIESLQTVKEKIHSITRESVLQELHALAFSDLKNVSKWTDGLLTLIPSEKLTPMASKSVKSIKESVTNGTSQLQITLHDKGSPLQTLCKILGLTEGSAGDDISEELTAALDDIEINGI